MHKLISSLKEKTSVWFIDHWFTKNSLKSYSLLASLPAVNLDLKRFFLKKNKSWPHRIFTQHPTWDLVGAFRRVRRLRPEGRVPKAVGWNHLQSHSLCSNRSQSLQHLALAIQIQGHYHDVELPIQAERIDRCKSCKEKLVEMLAWGFAKAQFGHFSFLLGSLTFGSIFKVDTLRLKPSKRDCAYSF